MNLDRARVLPWLVRFIDRWDDMAYDRDWPEWAYVPEVGGLALLCSLLRTHVVINDQCGKPAHRFCAYCRKRLPNATVTPWSNTPGS